ncbi:MAG: peptide chain release factor N(5)-glutamine methyltransferase [Cyclobacteriaceae bacterium]|nr:peptide chain release factor N(5)-glutamine methyltransferase [Cyclobacteriaceae bacterium]
MPNSKEVFDRFVSAITLDDSLDEKRSIAFLILECEFRIAKSQILANTEVENFDWQRLDSLIGRINKHEPIQYILGEQEFFGRTFFVNPSVLIPRPETELLVENVLTFARKRQPSINILDIGTGSGCIPITLALELPSANLFATDISGDAIVVAKTNAAKHKTNVSFIRSDIISDELPNQQFDVIVSNPPYIMEKEKATMRNNVLQYEPHEALFISNDDPLLFYRIIAAKAKGNLKPKGLLAFEINERFGKDMVQLLAKLGYSNIEIIKDFSGKDRIAKVINE